MSRSYNHFTFEKSLSAMLLASLSLVFGFASTSGVAEARHIDSNAPSSTQSKTTPHAYESTELLPTHLRFEISPDGTGYVARSNGYTVRIDAAGMTMALYEGAAPTAARKRGAGADDLPGDAVAPRKASLLAMTFVGAQSDARVEGLDRLSGVTNHLQGSDPAGWRTNVPAFARVRVSNVYPGIDVVWYSANGQLEYDFVVEPGADPNLIAMSFDGADAIKTDDDGVLAIHTPVGVVHQATRAAWQEYADGKRPVAAGFRVAGPYVGLMLPSLDPTARLVVDPAVTYSSYFGGSGRDLGNVVKADGAGNVYVAGFTQSYDFPVRNPAQGTFVFEEAWVAKFNLNQTGDSSLVYATYLGGSGFESAYDLVVFASGEVAISGGTASQDFPIVNGYQTTFGGGSMDAFVARLNANGSSLVYSTYLGGPGTDAGYAVGCSGTATIMVDGMCSAGFPVRTPYQTHQGAYDAFLACLDSSTPGDSSLIASTCLGGSGYDFAYSLAQDGSGAVYATGVTYSMNFPMTTLAQGDAAGNVFVTKMDELGSMVYYSTLVGGTGLDAGISICVDAQNSACIVGETDATNFPVVGGFASDSGDNLTDVVAFKLDASGGALLYSTYLGGAASDRAASLSLDASGNMYIVGFTNSANFPQRSATYGYQGLNDGFLARVNPTITGDESLVFSTYIGGTGNDYPHSVAVDQALNVYVTGETKSTDFQTQDGFQQVAGQQGDAFLVKISQIARCIGVYQSANSSFFLRNAHAGGSADLTVFFGSTGMKPVVGDWNGDGRDTVGVYDPVAGAFFLRNANSNGSADMTIFFGPANSTWIPLAGDWDGDGADGVGLYDPATSTFFLRNSVSNGPADVTVTFGLGNAGWRPLVGDWNGDGVTTIGLYTPAEATFRLKNSFTPGSADVVFTYGGPNMIPVIGDWNGDGVDTIGVYASSTAAWFLRDSNSSGNANKTFYYGSAGATPLVGDWDGR